MHIIQAALCEFSGKDKIPSEDALGRFLKKVACQHELLEECFEGLVEKLPLGL